MAAFFEELAFILENSTLGFCWWDLPAFILLVVVIVVFVIKRRDMKKEEKELEDQISELYAEETVEIAE